MMRPVKPDANTRKLALDQIAAKGLNAAAQSFGVAPQTLQRLAEGLAVAPGTIEQIKPKVRTAAEFKYVTPAVSPPIRNYAALSWPLAQIRTARDHQLLGNFRLPVRLAEAMRTDDALYVAYHNRIAPQSSVNATLTPASGARGQAVCNRAAGSCHVSRNVLSGINGTMANHGLAIGYNLHEPNGTGTRVDFRLIEWPLEFVHYRATDDTLWTSVQAGIEQPIVHGDGRWTIFRKFYDRPWLQEAAVIPGSMCYAAHANGVSDWAGSSRSHGLAKVIGEMAEGISMQGVDENGRPILSAEAKAMLDMLTAVVGGDSEVGIRPAGSKTDILQNNSTAWQVFSELLLNREKAAARIYLGTDGTMGTTGGAPGVDISALFGVATTKVQGDLRAIEQGLAVGVYQPWTAINCGDSRYAPSLIYALPDPDAEQRSAQAANAVTRLTNAITTMRAAGFVIDQAMVCSLAKKFNVDPIPLLGPPPTVQGAPVAVPPTPPAVVAPVQSGGPPKPKSLTLLAGDFDEAKHPRAENGKFGSGGGGGHPSPAGTDPKAAARAAAQKHFDDAAAKAEAVAKAGGHSEAMNSFLNKDRHAVSKAEREGTPNATSDATTAFLHDARKNGADYKGQVYRGTTPAELDQILKGGRNTTTWSVSKDPEGSAHFAKKGGVLIVIPRDSGAIPVDGLEHSNTFNEALVPKGSRWKVASERNANGVRVVTLVPAEHMNTLSDEPHDDSDIDAALSNPNTKAPPFGDGGNLELWG